MKHDHGVRKSRKQRKSSSHDPKMCGELFTFLTPAIIISILSRLPIRTILSCKCVCKSWLDLIESREFEKFHLSKSVPGLVVFLDAKHPKPFKFFEFADELNLNRRVRGWNLNLVLNFNIPCAELLHSSANGLLFLCNRGLTPRDFSSITIDDFKWSRDLFICNPITRDYIRLPCPQESSSSKAQFQMDTYGFGVSRRSEEHKLVRIFHGWIREFGNLTQSECQVYTVGTDSWRKVASGGRHVYGANAVAAFVNGNLHWLVGDLLRSSVRISCFDLETELFSTFYPPRSCDRGERLSMSALEGSLCICDTSAGDEIVIWLMKEYGNDKSWTKEFVIRKRSRSHVYGVVCPIKVFKNGDILMAMETCTTNLSYFTSKTKIIRKFDVFGLDCDFDIRAVMYTPSFLRLKTFATENGFRKSRRQKNSDHDAKMSYDFLTHLPRETVMDIFSRLPIRAIMICKCVCESWLEFVKSREFVKSHIRKSVPGVPLFLEGALSKAYKVVEFADEPGFDGDHEHPWKVDFRFNLPCREPLHSSVNGLLFLCNQGPRSRDLPKFRHVDVAWACKLFICNPVTRDYITLPCPQETTKYPLQIETYGFGASRMSGQYKLVRMFHGWIRELQYAGENECQVYTLGTGMWRSIGSGGRLLKYPCNAVGVFVNGNLHWLAGDLDETSTWISCFDLETEVFSTFSTNPRARDHGRWTLCAMGNCLGLCVNTSGEEESDNQLAIWLMKEYGDEKSWTKELVLDKEGPRNDPSFDLQVIKVFENGDILMVMERRRKLLYYSFKTKALQHIDVAEPDCRVLVHAIMYAPSFLSLKTFAREYVSSF